MKRESSANSLMRNVISHVSITTVAFLLESTFRGFRDPVQPQVNQLDGTDCVTLINCSVSLRNRENLQSFKDHR